MTGVKHTKQYKWQFDKVDSSGLAVFKHYTNENIHDVVSFLERQGIKYERRDTAKMLWIEHRGDRYSYYYTTGRWSPKTNTWPTSKHYHAKGIKDFIERFVFKRPVDDSYGYLYSKNGRYFYRRGIPKDIKVFYTQTEVYKNFGNVSFETARKRADAFNKKVEEKWEEYRELLNYKTSGLVTPLVYSKEKVQNEVLEEQNKPPAPIQTTKQQEMFEVPEEEEGINSFAYKKKILSTIKSRAKRKNTFFDLKESDIEIPTHCPILGIELEIGRDCWYNSPSIDRIDNKKGYTKENVVVVSLMCNTIKNQATPSQVRKVAEYYETLYKERGIEI
jgi:hypothetical protein